MGEYGNTIAQGQLTKVLYIDFMSSYMIKHNLFIDAGVTYRYSNSAIAAYQSENTWFTLGVRLNITRKEFDR